MGPMAEPGAYLFAVARGLDPETLRGATGLRGAPIEVVERDGLQALTCEVDLVEFGEVGLRRNLEDLGWVEEVARAHNEVVFRAATVATTAPMRLVTIFAGHDGVERMLAHHHDALADSLDAIEGCLEWSVKVYALAPVTPVTAAAQTAAAGAGGGTGAAYLQRKKAAAQQRRQASDAAAHLADEVHQLLAERSVASRRLPPQDPRLSGRTQPMLLNAAYLVPEADGETFHDVVRRVGEQRGDVTVELGGPWPPYSFTTLEWQ